MRMGEATKSSQHVSEAYLAAEHLLRFGSLTENRPVRLNIGEAIESSAVVVFHIPSALRGEAARAVASMALWAVMVEAAHRTERGLPKRHVHLAVDEYSQVASSRSAVDSGLVLARKWSIAIWAVFQDDTQLITPDGDLRSIIRSQCQRFLFARESVDEVDELRSRSSDVLRPDTSQSLRGMWVSTSVREVLEPGLSRNSILELSGVAMRAFAVLRLGDKHRDPIPFTILPPTASPADHERLKNKPLPVRTVPSAAVPLSGPPTPPADPDRPSRLRSLHNLSRNLHKEQSWRIRAEPPTKKKDDC